MSTADHDDHPVADTPDRSTMSTTPQTAGSPQVPAAPTTAPRRVHPFNTFFGLLFLVAAGAWLAREQGSLDGAELGRAVAVGLIVLGALGLVATVVVGRRGRRGVPAPVGTDPDPDPDA